MSSSMAGLSAGGGGACPTPASLRPRTTPTLGTGTPPYLHGILGRSEVSQVSCKKGGGM